VGIKGMTEDVLMNSIQKIQTACISNQQLYMSHCLTNDPKHPAVVACFCVCPDNIAKELHALLDATAAEFFAEHGIHIQ
jgi:hypothetical protein